MTRALILGRIRKGRQTPQIVAEIRGLLRDAGWKTQARVVTRKRDLRRYASKASRDGVEVVVVVGGDGAVLQMATALAGSKTRLGIIPTGTGNLLAGNLGIPTDRPQALETILAGATRRIDLGRVEIEGRKRCFTVACGVGFDAKVMDATEAEQKLRWGKLAYLANVLNRTGSVGNVPHFITLDGKKTRTEAAQVFVANFGKMLPLIEPSEQVIGDDGRLDVIVVRAQGPLEGLLAGWEAMTQKEKGESSGGRVFRTRARKVSIECRPRRLVEVDGSVIGRTPIRISVQPKALRVLVPEE